MDLERRQFIKLGLAASAGVAASGMMGVAAYTMTGRHVSRTTSNFHSHIDTVCRICHAGCGIRAFHDKHDNLVTIAGIPNHPVNKGRICAKALASINLVYHPERLMDSLFAQNNRGGEFAPIRYDRAVKQVATLIRSAKNKGALFVVDTEDDDPYPYHALFEMFEVDHKIISRPIARMKKRSEIDNKAFSGHPDYSQSSLVQPDLENARNILVFGANPFEGGQYYIALAKEIIDARRNNGAKLYVFDPINTNTAGKADKWLPIKPGTDYFAAAHLTKLLTGAYPAQATEFYGDLNGKIIEKITGISADEYIAVARSIKKAGNVSIVVGDGIYNKEGALFTRKKLRTLETIGGGKPFFVDTVPLDPDGLTLSISDIDKLYQNDIINKSGRKIFLITRRSNPVYQGYGMALEEALMDKEKLVGHFSICSFINETNRFADVIIPEKLPLEDWGLVEANWKVKNPTWTLQRPIPKSPAGIKSGYEVFMDVVAKLGSRGLAQTLGKNSSERTRLKIESMGLFNPVSKDRDRDYLFVSSPPDISKIDEVPEEEGENISKEILDAKVKKESPFKKLFIDDDGLTLVIHDTNVMNAELANCKWLGEISHTNSLRLNSDDAVSLGIKQGDKVRIQSGAKQITANADLCQSVARGVCAMAAGFGHDHFGKVALGQRRRADDPDAWLIWWGEKGNGENANQLSFEKTIRVKVTKG